MPAIKSSVKQRWEVEGAWFETLEEAKEAALMRQLRTALSTYTEQFTGEQLSALCRELVHQSEPVMAILSLSAKSRPQRRKALVKGKAPAASSEQVKAWAKEAHAAADAGLIEAPQTADP